MIVVSFFAICVLLLMVIVTYAKHKEQKEAELTRQAKEAANRERIAQASVPTVSQTTTTLTPVSVPSPPVENPYDPAKYVDSFSFRAAITNTATRQEYLRQIFEWEDPFLLCTYKIEKISANNKQVLRIVANLVDGNAHVIGFVPENLYDHVSALLDQHYYALVNVNVLHGISDQPLDAVCTIQWSVTLDKYTQYDKMVIQVKGVTYEGRQDILRKMATFDTAFAVTGCYLHERIFEGDPAFAVTVKVVGGEDQVIGMVAAYQVQDIMPIKDRIENIDLEIYGGDEGKNYGAKCEILYRK